MSVVPTKARVLFARFDAAVNIDNTPTNYVPMVRHASKISMYLDEHFLYIEVADERKPVLVMVPMSNVIQADLQIVKEPVEPPKPKKPVPVPALKKVS